jgi:uncharacterized membrane protein
MATFESYEHIMWPHNLKNTTSISEENRVNTAVINLQFKAKREASFIVLTCHGLLSGNVMTGRSFKAKPKSRKQHFARGNPHLNVRS